MPVHVKLQSLQRLWSRVEIQSPLVGVFAAVDHLVDPLEAVGLLQVRT